MRRVLSREVLCDGAGLVDAVAGGGDEGGDLAVGVYGDEFGRLMKELGCVLRGVGCGIHTLCSPFNRFIWTRS